MRIAATMKMITLTEMPTSIIPPRGGRDRAEDDAPVERGDDRDTSGKRRCDESSRTGGRRPGGRRTRPTAEISGTRRGALRSGRYAIRSTVTASSAADDHARPARPAPRTTAAGSPRAGRRLQRQRQLGAGERADHVDLAVRKIDEFEHAVDHGVAQRDQGIQEAERNAINQRLRQAAQRRPPSGRCRFGCCAAGGPASAQGPTSRANCRRRRG